ncbi:MAG: hypothetical protein AB2L14_18110 [Candidatus Xenobiia bacterium LiM19]
MGCVFKAKDTRLDNVVAVKQMLSTFANAQDAQYAETRFKEEAKMLSALKHNGLPKVIDYFTEKEPSTGKVMHYLVMEFIASDALLGKNRLYNLHFPCILHLLPLLPYPP